MKSILLEKNNSKPEYELLKTNKLENMPLVTLIKDKPVEPPLKMEFITLK
jgi:hypothetical protein